MKLKKTPLTYGWSLLAHEDCKVYVSVEDPSLFVIHDREGDSLLTVTSEIDTLETRSSQYDLKQRINMTNRTVTVFYDPEEE